MTAKRNAIRLVAIRKALRAAATPGESVLALADMVDLAAESLPDQGGHDDGQGTGNGSPEFAGGLLDEAIRHLRALTAGLPPDSDGYLMALYPLAEACLLRDSDAGPVPDIDDAIACLRRLRTALDDDPPGQAEIDARLSTALIARAPRGSGRLADLDEASLLLKAMMSRLAPEDPARRAPLSALAIAYATRFAVCGGTEDDREVAIEYAQACTADSGGGIPEAEAAAAGHYVLAWLALARQLTPAQRSGLWRRADMESARSDRQAAQALLSGLGAVRISREDAETAIAHLRMIPALPDSTELRVMLPMLWGLALAATLRPGEGLDPAHAADARRVAEELRILSGKPPADGPGPNELRAMRGTLLAMMASTPGAATAPGTSPGGPAADALALARDLPADNFLRPALLSALTHTLGQGVTQAASANDSGETGDAGDIGARLDEITAMMDLLPADDPASAQAMIAVGMSLLNMIATHRSALREERVIPKLERFSAALAPDAPLRPLARYMEFSGRALFAIMQHRTADLDSAITELAACADSVSADHVARPFMLAGLAVCYQERHAMAGEIRHLKLAEHYAGQAIAAAGTSGPFAPGTAPHGFLLFLRGHLQMIRCAYDPALGRIQTAITDLEQAQAMAGGEPALAPGITFSLQSAKALREILSAGSGHSMDVAAEAAASFDELLAAAKRTDRDSPDYAFLVAQAANGLMLRGVAGHDVALIDQAIALLAETAALPGSAARERTRLLFLHGSAFLARYWLTRQPRDLGNAIYRLEEARRTVEQEAGSPQAAEVLLGLAEAYRTRGDDARHDADRAVDLGLAGLREHAGDVFLQDSDENALLRAARGAGQALGMARWFLGHGRGDAAIAALELGRGMVLHAATSGVRAEDMLRESGHEALADEWRDQDPGAGAAEDLRYRVMAAVERSPAEARLLAPPSTGEIAAALTQTGADALVYLLPQDDEGPGLAVLVYPDGTIGRVPLRGLRTDDGSRVSTFVQARRAMETAEKSASEATDETTRTIRASEAETALVRWRETLGALCDWAWPAVVRPVLDALRDHRGTTWPRVALVPGGELGLVPWHAARQSPSGRYAVQDAVFLYASSARQFTDTARFRPRPWTDSPVLISDAGSSLYYSPAAIGHLHAAHYGTGAVFGFARRKLPGSIPGARFATRDDVLNAFSRDGSAGASMLHFGCHGHVGVPVLDSHLELGKDGSGAAVRVGIRDILRQARTRRTSGGSEHGGLVVLAACVTDVTERDFDEALSLATALVSAGATGVVATRWSVPERHTALFMAAFHQFLNDGYHDPALALREAQLWMLDPHRKVPDRWPKLLREEATTAREHAGGPHPDDPASPEAWAGFTYQGR
jgi:hypothetical protein